MDDLVAAVEQRFQRRSGKSGSSCKDDFQCGEIMRWAPDCYMACRCCLTNLAVMRCCFRRDNFSTKTLPSK